MAENIILRRSPDVVSEVVDGRALLVSTAGMELITLNAVGSIVWEGLAEPATRSALTDLVLERVTGATREQVESDVDAFLSELRAAGVVVEG
jgi:coenzyme PQQ synthesis protein D (PqqD)